MATDSEVPVPGCWDGARFEYRMGFTQGAQGERLRVPIRATAVDALFRREAWRAGHRLAKALKQEADRAEP